MAEPVRRTQQERKEATIQKLLDATRESLIEVGYAGTSIQQICQRAEVSHGGLFRHFDSRIELMIATAKFVADSLIDLYLEQFGRLRSVNDPFELGLRLLRGNCESHDTQVWFELLMAARSDEQLRKAIQPIWEHNRNRTLAMGEKLFPELAQRDDFVHAVDCIIHLFHGEAINAVVGHALKEGSQERLDIANKMLKGYIS